MSDFTPLLANGQQVDPPRWPVCQNTLILALRDLEREDNRRARRLAKRKGRK